MKEMKALEKPYIFERGGGIDNILHLPFALS